MNTTHVYIIRHFTSALVVALGIFGLSNCSDEQNLVSGLTTDWVHFVPVKIPVSIAYKPSSSFGLASENPDSEGLDLAPTVATNLMVAVAGCSSGYTLAETTITSGVVNLYRGDENCKVELLSFTIGTKTYAGTFGATANWVANSVATYTNVAPPSDTIKVFLTKQVTAGGILSTDTVVYNFTDIQGGPTPTVLVTYAAPLSVTGVAAPDLSVAFARFLSVNANGSGNFAFTLACGVLAVGSGATETCDGINESTQFKYMLVPDIYSGVPTVQQAIALFNGTNPTPVAVSSAKTIAAGGSDDSSNVIPDGGFYTGNTTPLVTGTTPIFPSNLKYVFLVEQLDTSGNQQSFIYFDIVISTITQL